MCGRITSRSAAIVHQDQQRSHHNGRFEVDRNLSVHRRIYGRLDRAVSQGEKKTLYTSLRRIADGRIAFLGCFLVDLTQLRQSIRHPSSMQAPPLCDSRGQHRLFAYVRQLNCTGRPSLRFGRAEDHPRPVLIAETRHRVANMPKCLIHDQLLPFDRRCRRRGLRYGRSGRSSGARLQNSTGRRLKQKCGSSRTIHWPTPRTVPLNVATPCLRRVQPG